MDILPRSMYRVNVNHCKEFVGETSWSSVVPQSWCVSALVLIIEPQLVNDDHGSGGGGGGGKGRLEIITCISTSNIHRQQAVSSHTDEKNIDQGFKQV